MTVGAGLGLMTFPFSGPSAFWRWIDLCESGGVDSYWQSDRLVSRTPILESMSVMAATAGRTKRLKFGMNVVSIAFREPLLIAKECATIDFLSEGRLLPAFGIGSPHSRDWEALGVDTRRHGRRTDEALSIIERLWRGETVDCDGEFFRYRGAEIAPLPVQQPLPLWLGGSSPAAIRRTARYGTGWIGGPETPAEAAAVVEAVAAACEETGRRVPDDHFGASFFFRFGSRADPIVEATIDAARRRRPDRDPAAAIVVGGAGEILERIREFVAGGVTKFVLRPMGDDDDLMRQTRAFVERVQPDLVGLEI